MKILVYIIAARYHQRPRSVWGWDADEFLTAIALEPYLDPATPDMSGGRKRG